MAKAVEGHDEYADAAAPRGQSRASTEQADIADRDAGLGSEAMQQERGEREDSDGQLRAARRAAPLRAASAR